MRVLSDQSETYHGFFNVFSIYNNKLPGPINLTLVHSRMLIVIMQLLHILPMYLHSSYT